MAERYQGYVRSGQLLNIRFVTVKDYLFLLRDIATQVTKTQPKAMLYLAAAVSDFFIPDQKMVRLIPS